MREGKKGKGRSGRGEKEGNEVGRVGMGETGMRAIEKRGQERVYKPLAKSNVYQIHIIHFFKNAYS